MSISQNSQFLTRKNSMPNLGVGLGFRRELADDILRNRNAIDWLEISPENYMGIGGEAQIRLTNARETFPLISHGLSLSIGSADDLNPEYLRELKAIVDYIDAPWWSDHLCFSSIGGRYLYDLLPMPLTEEAVKHVIERIQYVQAFIGRPFLIENISYYLDYPNCEMTEAQFIRRIVEEADCGLLLDVNNIYVNAINHKFDAIAFIDQLPLERVVQIHIAGHQKFEGTIIDTHGMPVNDQVFALLEYVLARSDVKALLLERDQNFPQFSELLTELEAIRAISARHSRTLPTPSTKLQSKAPTTTAGRS